MEAAHNPHRMATWESLPVGTDHTQETPGEIDAQGAIGLTAEVEHLHAEFHQEANHLNEVQAMHQEVLVSAGMLPETHMAEVHPDRQLKWMVEALHGKVNPDGLTIPLLGVSAEDVALFTKKDGERTMLKLVVQDGDNEPLEREMPLPDADSEVSANYINGRLHLRW